MKKIKIAILSATAFLGGNVAIAQTYSAAVPVKTQSQTNWCWATDSQCVLEYYGTKKTQCEIVEYARVTITDGSFGSNPCCTSPSGKCNSPNELDFNYGVKGMLDHFGNIKSAVTSGMLPSAKIISELDSKRPFIIGIYWNGGNGHVVVGCGFNKSNTTITVMDSWNGNGMTTAKYNSGGAISINSGSGTVHETLVISTPYTTTGINETDATANISVFPNPSEGVVNIQSADNLKTINVYNTTGQLVDSYIVAGEKTYALKIAVAGLYNVQLITDNGIAYKKVVVSNN
ncbi:MAG TPA: papain-like cysteine protease family protein [Bacteroidia bacterium]|jgi:hypothetical protein|nr:papain-like cysteine protease family protein [Bacteroidia bacterium]